MRDLSHKTTPLLSQLVNALPNASTVDFSVWPRVKLPVAVFSLWALAVHSLHIRGYIDSAGAGMGSVTGILSMVTGLMVSFRSSSSYDRWYEGRRMWASIQSTLRTSLRHVALSPASTAARNELSALLCTFPFATMHLLRSQGGLKDALPLSVVEGLPLGLLRSVEESDEAEEGGPNVPVLTVQFLHASLSVANGGVDAGTSSAVMGALKDLTEQLTALERIRDTPIPLILNLHLQLLLFVYVAAVPLQLVSTLGIFTIPATAITAFVFYGVDRAGEELSDPFGTELNDLPLERYCKQVHDEYLELVEMRGKMLSQGGSKSSRVLGTDAS